ncbi:MAG: site-2 protease family protein [Cyclobacteriaceae bacterium]|nr:site-2 protease family protein [Cyclobacteriaceae bacterium]
MSRETKRIIFQVVLFVATLGTTTLAGAEWAYGKSILMEGYSWDDFLSGFNYSLPFLFILSAHEFGHYFTAVYHRVKTSLPYYIPLPPFFFILGTLGAVIRLRERVPSTTKNFDIGVAGPLAGFVAAIGVLVYAFLTLPPPEYVFQFHPDYQQYGLDYAAHVYGENMKGPGVDIVLGNNIMFTMLSWIAPQGSVPNMHEVIHYPALFAGYLSLVFTSLNLLPIGQLDGGHVVYGLFGSRLHRWIASVTFVGFVFFAGLGVVTPVSEPSDFLPEFLVDSLPRIGQLLVVIAGFVLFLFYTFKALGLSRANTWMTAIAVFAVQYLATWMIPSLSGYSGWLLFAFLVGRFGGVLHPPALIEEPLTPGRKLIGWLALLIFVLCMTPWPIEMLLVTETAP